jgi:1-acyl-sn-glycerol-3-phosphate acyltransferase
MNIFCSLKIRGIENIEGLKGNVIIASNHTCELDPLLIVACLPFFSHHLPLYFVSREKIFYQKKWRSFMYGGTFFRMMGAYQAYVGLKNYEQALRHHLDAIQKGNNVCIFPMGKIYLLNEPAKAKGGVSFLAQKTQLPIIPVLIQGIEQLTFADFLTGKRKLTVTFGSPLYTKDIFQNTHSAVINDNRNKYEEAAAVLMEKIAQLA